MGLDKSAGQPARLWLFDFDNTIAHLEPEVDWAGGRRVLEPYLRGAGAPEDLFAQIPRGNLPLYDAYRAHLVANGGIDGAAQSALRQASEIIEQIELAGVERAAELEGAIAMLAQLRASAAKIAIVTSNSSRTVARWFAIKRAPAVDAIVGRDSLLALKPSPEMVMRALEVFSARAAEAAFVGDSAADLLAAEAAGVRFYGVAASEAARDRLSAAGAQEIFASPAALAAHLNRMAPSATARGGR